MSRKPRPPVLTTAATNIAHQPMQPPVVKHARALTLSANIPVTTLLCQSRRLPPHVPRVEHTKAEPRGDNKVIVRHEVGVTGGRQQEGPTPASRRPEISLVVRP